MYYKLNVDYAHKEDAKRYGARWDRDRRTWYYIGDGDLPEGLKRYVVEAQRPKANPDYIVSAPGTVSAPDFSKYRTVSELNQFIKGIYGTLPAFQNVLVKGEVANYSAPDRNGNYWFSLKEDKVLINCVLWASEAPSALSFPLKSGQQVALEGKLDFFAGAGRTQITVRKLYDIGAGEAALKLEQLRKKLEALGWFKEELKKPVPSHPRRIGIVTSASGQAIQDFDSTTRKRNPYVQLELYPVNVQGIYAAASIVKGIEYMDKRGYDLIIVGRGGGSDEELYVFNDEAIVTAVHNAATPIVSAVGHTGNFTLIDAVSDGFANTPTGAIEKYVPELKNDLEFLSTVKNQFRTGAERVLAQKREAAVSARVQLEQQTPAHRLHRCTEALQKERSQIQKSFTDLIHSRDRLIAETGKTLEKYNPVQLLQKRSSDLRLMNQQLTNAVHSLLERSIHRFRVAVTEMNGLSPTAKLINGFGYITHEERPVLNVSDVQAGDEVSLTLHDGEILTEVQSVHTYK